MRKHTIILLIFLNIILIATIIIDKTKYNIKCIGEKKYKKELTIFNSYRSPENFIFKTTVDFMEADDFKATPPESSRVNTQAYMAYLVYKAYEDSEKNLVKRSKVQKALSNSHAIVAHTNEEFARLRAKPNCLANLKNCLKKISKVQAFVVWNQSQCWDTPKGANFSVVFRLKAYTNPGIIIHELIHIIGNRGFNDGDSGHVNKKLWATYGNDTIQRKALKLYEKETGTNCENSNLFCY